MVLVNLFAGLTETWRTDLWTQGGEGKGGMN